MRSPKQPAKLAMLLLLALLLLFNGVGNVHCSTIHENRGDLRALLDFQQGITSDPHGALSNWTITTHFCRWNGVTCTTTRPFRVSSLMLTNLDLAGQITSSLGNLTLLETLVLSSNNFVGPLPILGHLQQLETLYLDSNSLDGIIPDSLTNCSNLANLDLSRNSLAGAIPPELGYLPNMAYINFKSNKLEGSIPGELGRLSKLGSLLLGYNRLSGEFPRAILNLSSLQYLSLEFNMLGQELPPNIGDLHYLTQLTLEANSFEGHIPVSLGNALGLEIIDLSNNSFTGKIPTTFGKLSNLKFLSLQENYLEARDDQDWEFLNALRKCSSLKFLAIGFNELQGLLPDSVGNLSTSLQNLLLTGNSLSGQVPQSIGKLSGLTRLSLGNNNFNGTIEGWIKNLTSIRVLSLQSNNFTGPIPSSIGNLTKLVRLNLSENKFEGPIPDSVGNLRTLSDLDLGHNNLDGPIPPNFANLQQLAELYLGRNNLQGNIPQIRKLKQLTSLDISLNKLTGEIPDSLGECYGLTTLQLNQNFLTGSIPISFGNLSSLIMLNLSHNNLSGKIPLTLNKLDNLTSLDLSYNHLQGVIPRNGVFENATAVSLEGNEGLCGGAMDLHMASCTFTVSKKTERRYRLIKVLIPIFGFMSLVLLVYFLLLEKKMRRRTDDTSDSLGENFIKVSYADLAQATTNFSESNLVGRGGYGSVYRGKLKESKVEVAVKVFDLEMQGAEKSFLKECEALRSIQHRNLLPIITACSTVDNTGNIFKALVYEFMPNGNLDTWLHQEDGKVGKPLTLGQRLSIAVNMADALDYLHYDCGRPTIHCDLKPSNILLDDDMNALLGDFGIASFYEASCSTSVGPVSSSSVGVKGTIGYIAPEYAGGGRRASTSGDVYGFGIILLELMTGKRPTDPMFKDGVTIVDFVDKNFPHEIVRVVDANLSEECKDIVNDGCLVSVLQLALFCTRPVPSERMNMKEIASKMHAIKTSYVGRKSQQSASVELG